MSSYEDLRNREQMMLLCVTQLTGLMPRGQLKVRGMFYCPISKKKTMR